MEEDGSDGENDGGGWIFENYPIFSYYAALMHNISKAATLQWRLARSVLIRLLALLSGGQR